MLTILHTQLQSSHRSVGRLQARQRAEEKQMQAESMTDDFGLGELLPDPTSLARSVQGSYFRGDADNAHQWSCNGRGGVANVLWKLDRITSAVPALEWELNGPEDGQQVLANLSIAVENFLALLGALRICCILVRRLSWACNLGSRPEGNDSHHQQHARRAAAMALHVKIIRLLSWHVHCYQRCCLDMHFLPFVRDAMDVSQQCSACWLCQLLCSEPSGCPDTEAVAVAVACRSLGCSHVRCDPARHTPPIVVSAQWG